MSKTLIFPEVLMKALCAILLIIMLPVLLTADFDSLQTIIELEGDQYFYYDNVGGCSIAGDHVSYAVVKIDLSEEMSWLEIYRSDDGGESFTVSEVISWDSLPEILEINWYITADNYYQKPVIFTSETGSLQIFYEDVETGESMLASAEEYWGVFNITASPFTDMYNDPFLWQDGEELWSLGLSPSSIPVCCFQSYMGRMISVNSTEESWDVLMFWGPDVFDGEVYTNSDIWIRQIGGGTNNCWPTMNGLVISGETIMDFATGAPAVNSAPMEDIFTSGYLEEYVAEMGEIELQGAEEVRENGFILDASADRDILFAKIDGTTATCRYADILYEEMEFTVYNSYPDPMHPEWSIGDPIWTNVVQVPHIEWEDTTFNLSVINSSVFCYCELWIEGSVSGNMTWASADTIYITDDITYTSLTPGEEVPFDCTDMFGLISEKSILIKYKHWDPDTEEIESPNCDDVMLYGAYAACGVADPNSAYPGYEEGVFSFEYQHPHGSTPDFMGVSPFTGNDTLFSYIDLHKYVMPPAEGYTGDPEFILHSNHPVVGYPSCGYPYENPDYEQAEVAPYGTDKPFYNPVWPESSEDIGFERGYLNIYGSVAQRRGGFSHRSGMDPSNHDDNCLIDEGEHLYGGTHESVGYVKTFHYDERMNYEIYPVDFTEVDNYFKQYSSNFMRSDFDMGEVDEMGDMEMKAWIYPKLLSADNEGDEYVALTYQDPDIAQIVYSEAGEIYKELVGFEELDYEIREVYRDGDMIYIETKEYLYSYQLGNSGPLEVVEEILEPEQWHGVEWNSAGVGILMKIGEGDNNINIEKYNTETDEFEQLVNYDLPSAEILNELYDELDFAYHVVGNGNVVATYARSADTEEYYQELYQMRGEISILPEGDDDLVPLANDLSIYPNPFNPELTVHYNLEEAQRVEIAIYNLRGEKVKTLLNEQVATGAGEKVWDGSNSQGSACGSGVYFVQMKAGEQQLMLKAVLLK